MSKKKDSNEISLLKEQMIKLESSDFELNAWKSYTIILLERIFGYKSQKIIQIEKINFDYSSWSLRDTSGSSGNLASCKKIAKEIIQSSIDELINKDNLTESLEVESDGVKSGSFISVDEIMMIFENELKGSQVKELRLILSSKDDLNQKKNRIVGKIKEYGVNTAPEILALILLSEGVSQYIK